MVNLLNWQNPNPQMGGLLGQYYDPKEMRQQALWSALTQAGLGLLSQGPSKTPIGIGDTLAAGFKGGIEGAQQGQQDYMQQGLLAKQMADAEAQRQQEQQDRLYNRNKDARQDALAGKQRLAQDQWLQTVPPEQRSFAQAYPDQYASQYGQTLFPSPDAAKPTDDMREYEFAKSQGYQGNFQQFQIEMRKAGANSVTLNNGSEVGPIAKGYELFTDPQTGARSMRPIPGSEEWSAQQKAAQTQNQNATNKQVSADIVTQDIDRAIAALNEPSLLPKTGFGAETLKGYGGTGAADLAGLLSSVEANVGFDSLAAMRAASPTGGALGQITERELALLAATKGAITQSQSKDQLVENLNRLWNVTQDIVHGPNAGPPRRKLNFEQQSPETHQPKASNLPYGTKVNGVEAIPEGATVMDAQGKRFVKRNGQLVPE